MRCPECRKEFHPQPDSQHFYESREANGDGFGVLLQLCPSCYQFLVIYQEGPIFKIGEKVFLGEIEHEYVLFPESNARELPDEVPERYRAEFFEAVEALEYSPKASAALSRRMLQKILREEMKIKKKDLSLEIDEFINSANAPTYLNGAIDAIRQIGNFASHPMKYINSGEIVEVEDGEAEWILDTLESLCDFVFVQPSRLIKRQTDLNKKLEALGKPPLKQ